jgi:GT2 family glycosyltransferase
LVDDLEKNLVISGPIADVAVLIVGFHNPDDIRDCLSALSRAASEPAFDIFVCENGGADAFRRLLAALLSEAGPCDAANDAAITSNPATSRCTDVRRLRLRGRSSNVWIACATGNLGYAGGINVWLDQLKNVPGWKGIWILNPDTEPDARALAAMVERAETANKGMIGSTILDIARPDRIHCRGGIHWQKLLARPVSIGFGDPVDAPHDVTAIEAAMDCPSGASMYVTRQCIGQIGPMDETYFLFSEDLDWGLRAKTCGLGYASASIVRHKRGTTTGSAMRPAAVPRFSVYLQHRNAIRFVRKYFPLTLPIGIIVMCLYAAKYLVGRAPQNFVAGLQGTLAGLRGEIGPPPASGQFGSLAAGRGAENEALGPSPGQAT